MVAKMEFTRNRAAVSHRIPQRALFWVLLLLILLAAVFFLLPSPKQKTQVPGTTSGTMIVESQPVLKQPDTQIVPMRATKIAERVVDPDGDSNQEQELRKSLILFLEQQDAAVGQSRLWVGPIPTILDLNVQESSVTINFSAAMASSGTSVFENNYGLIANVVHDVMQGDGIDPIYPSLTIQALVEGQSILEVFP